MSGGWGGGGGAGGGVTDASYLTLAAHADLSAEVVVREPFHARMQVDSTTSITLQRYAGSLIVVNGEAVDPGAGGLAMAPSDNLISSTGTDSGGNMAPSTLYYVYVSNASASFAPTDLRASATSPSLVNGVKYLATSGNGANWRFVGWVRTNATGTDGEFVDSNYFRHCINYYNRRPLLLFFDLGYVDDDAGTSFTLAAAAMARIRGGTSDNGSYIGNGEDAISVHIRATYAEISARFVQISIGDDSTTDQTCSAYRVGTAAASIGTYLNVTRTWVPTEGYHTLAFLASVDTSTHTFYIDFNDNAGGTIDPQMTYLQGWVMG